MQETKTLKIIRLEASNIKRLKAVNITPEGSVVVISGENDQGKSSVLDSILYALGGKDSICDVPIRAGTAKANITCDLGELIVERTFSASGGTTLKVTGKDKKTVPSPQSVLDKLCSKVAFDPLSFVKMDAKARAETLRKLVGLDFTQENAARKAIYEERTMVNRDIEASRVRLLSLPDDNDVPAAEVSVTDLMDQLTAIEKHNILNHAMRDSLNQDRFAMENMEMSIKSTQNQVDKLLETLAELKKKQEKANKAFEAKSVEVEKLVDEDTIDLKSRIKQADTVNERFRNHAKKQIEIRKHSELVSHADALTNKIKAFDDAREKALSNAKFPLPGLSFDDSGVVLNGVPFEQGSQAQQLKAAIAVGLALNPTVRVILIRDASLLDKKNLSVVAEMARAADAQIWLEVVSSDDQSAIIIEDGNVKETKTVDEPKLL